MTAPKKKFYAVTKVDGVEDKRVLEGFEGIAEMIGQGHKVSFRAFPSPDKAEDYLRTGLLNSGGHAGLVSRPDAGRAASLGVFGASRRSGGRYKLR